MAGFCDRFADRDLHAWLVDADKKPMEALNKSQDYVREALIHSTVATNCAGFSAARSTHILEYTVFAALPLWALRVPSSHSCETVER